MPNRVLQCQTGSYSAVQWGYSGDAVGGAVPGAVPRWGTLVRTVAPLPTTRVPHHRTTVSLSDLGYAARSQQSVVSSPGLINIDTSGSSLVHFIEPLKIMKSGHFLDFSVFLIPFSVRGCLKVGVFGVFIGF